MRSVANSWQIELSCGRVVECVLAVLFPVGARLSDVWPETLGLVVGSELSSMRVGVNS